MCKDDMGGRHEQQWMMAAAAPGRRMLGSGVGYMLDAGVTTGAVSDLPNAGVKARGGGRLSWRRGAATSAGWQHAWAGDSSEHQWRHTGQMTCCVLPTCRGVVRGRWRCKDCVGRGEAALDNSPSMLDCVVADRSRRHTWALPLWLDATRLQAVVLSELHLH
jgi:hypothetical protein